MVWTSPMTAVAHTAFPAASFNTHVRDNLLETEPAKATAAGGFMVTTAANAITMRTPQSNTTAASQTTTSTSFADLATIGPIVTITTGTSAFVIISARMSNNTANSNTVMGFAVSGATTIAANSGDDCLWFEDDGTSATGRASTVSFITNLNAGSNTFTAKYLVQTPSTGTFSDRSLAVIPF